LFNTWYWDYGYHLSFYFWAFSSTKYRTRVGEENWTRIRFLSDTVSRIIIYCYVVSVQNKWTTPKTRVRFTCWTSWTVSSTARTNGWRVPCSEDSCSPPRRAARTRSRRTRPTPSPGSRPARRNRPLGRRRSVSGVSSGPPTRLAPKARRSAPRRNAAKAKTSRARVNRKPSRI